VSTTKGLLKSGSLSTGAWTRFDQWCPYLQHKEFLIRTDQHSLVHLDDQRLTTQWQHKAFTKLLGLQYKICYRKGPENSATYAPSRRQHEVIHVVRYGWMSSETATAAILWPNDGFRNSSSHLTLRTVSLCSTTFYILETDFGWEEHHTSRENHAGISL
jgi:hypothetical protein